jgi:hypothetical protein
MIMSNYTEEELAVHAQLGILSHNILNMEMPANVKAMKAIAEARKISARNLHELGYSTRQIARALGLKSPQSVSVYLRADDAVTDLAAPTPLANTDVANPPSTPPKQADPGASNEK